MTRTGVPERQYFINRQIKEQIHAGVSVLLCLFGWLFFVFADFFQLGLQNGQLFLGQIVA